MKVWDTKGMTERQKRMNGWLTRENLLRNAPLKYSHGFLAAVMTELNL